MVTWGIARFNFETTPFAQTVHFSFHYHPAHTAWLQMLTHYDPSKSPQIFTTLCTCPSKIMDWQKVIKTSYVQSDKKIRKSITD
jgi:hypothetical protein